MLVTDSFIGNDASDYFNSNGHRCKEPSELNFRNYILFAGDNINLGLDKPIEQTVPYLVSKSLKTDYYDLSVFNGGIDIFKYNVINWFIKYKDHPPKCLVVSFEFLNAISVYDIHSNHLKSPDNKDENVDSLYHYGELCRFFHTRKLIVSNIIKNLIQVPIYQVSFLNKSKLFDDSIIDIKYNSDMFDYNSVATSIITEYKNNNVKLKP
jgi:hypothetical protein